MVVAGTFAVVTTLWCASPWAAVVVTRLRAPPAPPAPPADTRLTGLLVRRDRFWGLRNRGAVTRFGVLPALVLANRRFPLPSREVMGRVPPEASA